MTNYREILRLHSLGLNKSQISQSIVPQQNQEILLKYQCESIIILVGKTEESVRYSTSYGGDFKAKGSVIFNGQKYYYGDVEYYMSSSQKGDRLVYDNWKQGIEAAVLDILYSVYQSDSLFLRL